MIAGALFRRLRRRLRELERELELGPATFDTWLDPATPEQLRRIDRLCDDQLHVSPTWQPLSQRQAETITRQLLAGEYDPDAWGFAEPDLDAFERFDGTEPESSIADDDYPAWARAVAERERLESVGPSGWWL